MRNSRSAISRLTILAGIAFSGSAGLLTLHALGNLQISVSGGITILLLVTSGALLTIYLARDRDFRPIGAFALFWAFLAFVALRSVGTANFFSTITHVVIIATSIIIGSLVIAERRLRTISVKSIDRWLSLALLLTMIIILADLVFGDLTLTPRGFLGSLGLSSRILALYLLPFLALYLSKWRYSSSRESYVHLLVSILLVLIVLLSLSRTVTAVTLAVLIPLRFINKYSVSKSLVAFLLGGSLLILWFLTPPIQQRFFFGSGTAAFDSAANVLYGLVQRNETPGRLDSEETASQSAADGIDEFAQYIDTQGRLGLWSFVWQSALEAPVFGNGTGSASVASSEANPKWEHPLNDYLRVFHDLGVVGLVLFVGAWLHRIYRHGRLWLKREDMDTLAARFHMTALLSALGMSVVFITDNALLYVFVGIPVFLQFALAEAAELERHENRVRN